VDVRPGETAPLNISWLPEDTGVQTITVSEPRPIAKPDSAERGTSLAADTMSRVPTGRSYQSVAQFIPGVTGGANPNIRGGLSIQNRYLVDGLDITDPVTGTFSTNLSFDSIGSVQVLTGGMEAQYNSLGGVIDVITSGGSEDFHINSSFYLNHQKLSFNNAYGPQLYNGKQDFNDVTVGPNKSYQVNLNVGGPIIRKRLWYNASYELRLNTASPTLGPPLGAPPYNIQHAAQDSQVHLIRLKLTYAPNPAHRISISGNADPAFFNNVAGGDKNTYLGVVEDRQNQGGFFTIASWDWFLNPNVNTNVQAGFQVNTIEFGPQGQLGSIDKTGCDLFKRMDNCTWIPERAQHTNLVDNTTWYQGDAYVKDSRYTVQFDPSVSIRGKGAGFHDIKAGIQARYNYRKENDHTPGGFLYTDNTDAGLTLDAGLCDPTSPDGLGCYRQIEVPDVSVHETAYAAGLYFQDRWWTPLTWLTVVPGLRFDYGHTADRNGHTISNLWGLGPRLALVGDLTRDGRNVVSASYGRSNEVLSLLPGANFDSAESSVNITREWDQTMHGFTREISRTGGSGNVIIDPHLTTPHADELIFSVRRQIFTSTLAGVDYNWKRLSNIWDAIEINQIWDPSGNRVIDYVDKTKMGQTVLQYATPSGNHRTYQGISLYAEGRPTRNWDINGSYTLSWTYGPGVTEFGQISAISQYDNPRNARYFDGFVLDDRRHVLKGFAAYQVGPFNMGAAFTYATGVPLAKRFFSAQAGDYVRYRAPLGTEPGNGNDLKQISEFRTPDNMTVDLRAVFNVFPTVLNQQLRLILDVFNTFNTRNATNLVIQDVTRFGQVSARAAPLRLQLAINYVY
jgi:hypothetical protein